MDKKIYSYNFPKNIKLILNRLNQHGQGFLVGGCIRDILDDKEPKDFDFTTNISYEKLIDIFSDYKVKEIGASFGVIQVVINENSYEISKFRIDNKESDGRHPLEISYTDDITKDLERRDFTINALAFNFENGLIDNFGGLEDIKNRKIRFIGNASERIKEDGLRILRAFRFQATKSFEIEKSTLKEIEKNKKMLDKISTERITQEFNQILLGDFKKTIYDMKNTGILEKIIPEIKACYNFDQDSKYHEFELFEHIIGVIENTPSDLELRYAALMHDLGKPKTRTFGNDGYSHYYGHEIVSAEIAEYRLKELKFPTKFIQTVKNLCIEHMVFHRSHSDKIFRKIISKYGENFCRKLIYLNIADNRAKGTNIDIEAKRKELFENFERVTLNSKIPTVDTLALNGNDLIKLGYVGKEIGIIKNKLLDFILNDNIENRKEILIEKLKNIDL